MLHRPGHYTCVLNRTTYIIPLPSSVNGSSSSMPSSTSAMRAAPTTPPRSSSMPTARSSSSGCGEGPTRAAVCRASLRWRSCCTLPWGPRRSAALATSPPARITSRRCSPTSPALRSTRTPSTGGCRAGARCSTATPTEACRGRFEQTVVFFLR